MLLAVIQGVVNQQPPTPFSWSGGDLVQNFSTAASGDKFRFSLDSSNGVLTADFTDNSNTSKTSFTQTNTGNTDLFTPSSGNTLACWNGGVRSDYKLDVVVTVNAGTSLGSPTLWLSDGENTDLSGVSEIPYSDLDNFSQLDIEIISTHTPTGLRKIGTLSTVVG